MWPWTTWSKAVQSHFEQGDWTRQPPNLNYSRNAINFRKPNSTSSSNWNMHLSYTFDQFNINYEQLHYQWNKILSLPSWFTLTLPCESYTLQSIALFGFKIPYCSSNKEFTLNSAVTWQNTSRTQVCQHPFTHLSSLALQFPLGNLATARSETKLLWTHAQYFSAAYSLLWLRLISSKANLDFQIQRTRISKLQSLWDTKDPCRILVSQDEDICKHGRRKRQ